MLTNQDNAQEKTIFTLLQVSRSIQKTVSDRYQNSYWITAEMNKLNFYKQSGHCYPELVEKQDGKVIAQMRANLWKDDYLRINNVFQQVLKEPLKEGIKILFLATISFDPVYGLSLRIMDIDPAYTMGDLEKEKQETIKKLQEEGIFNQNKSLELPMLPQRIAIISVETSKGFADFLKVIEGNHWKYKFFHLLFPSLLQGEKAVEGIIGQLRRIKKVIHHFDVVAIIRGGGGDIGLACYNNYFLAKEIALFPIPVITGIGHATNETVAKMISFSNAITPTKLAEYLLQEFHNFSVPVQEAESRIIDKSRRLISDEKTKFRSEIKLFRSVTENILNSNRNNIREEIRSLFLQSHFRFKTEKSHMNSSAKQVMRSSVTLIVTNKEKISRLKEMMSERLRSFFKNESTSLLNIGKNVNNMSPKEVMRRGYSITLLNGKAIKSSGQAKNGDVLNTVVFDGTIDSIVKSSSKSKES